MRIHLRKLVLFCIASFIITAALFTFLYRSIYIEDGPTAIDNFISEDKLVVRHRSLASKKLTGFDYPIPSLLYSYNISSEEDLFDFSPLSSTRLTFAIPKCPELENFPQPRQQTFQRVSDERHDIYIFSAYSDHRVDLEVRLVAITLFGLFSPIHCELFYGSVTKTATHTEVRIEQFAYVEAAVAMLPESQGFRYGGALVLCRNAIMGRVPLAVSVFPASRLSDPSRCVRPYNLFLVQSTLPVEGRLLPDGTLASRTRALHSSRRSLRPLAPPPPPVPPDRLESGPSRRRSRFAVCVTPLNLRYEQPVRLVETLEFNRLLGAQHMFFYNYSVGARTGALLERYARGELALADEARAFRVSLVQWRVPVRVHVWPRPAGYLEEVHYFAQMAMLNECLLRALRRFEYLVFTDLDEFAIPRSPEFGTWHDLYERYFPRVPAAVYVFQNTFFRLEFADDAATASNETIRALDVQALLKTKRENRIYPPGSRSKYIVSADAVEIVGIHGVDRFSPAHRLGLIVFGGATEAEAEAVRSEAKGDSQPVPLARRFGPGRSLSIAARRMEETHFLQPEVGLLHHYRNFDAPPGPEYVVDRYVPTRFGDALLSRIAAARHKLALAPT